MAAVDVIPLDGSRFGSRFSAFRLVRWTTSPEGSISLTKKSVYLCALDAVSTAAVRKCVPFLQYTAKT